VSDDETTGEMLPGSLTRRPFVASVNVGLPRSVEWRGREVTTAIWKEPTTARVQLQGINATGDAQADLRVHGGPDKAIYAYAVEDYEWWASSVGPLEPATFGENLTTSGIDLRASHIGDRWRVGDALLEVSQPRSPCFKLGIRMVDEGFPLRFIEAGRPGTYLRIIEPGSVTVGDEIEVSPTHPPAVSVGSLSARTIEMDVLRLAALDERVPEGWRRRAAKALEASE
jgi:MOSC domain-containing protein YiiM